MAQAAQGPVRLSLAMIARDDADVIGRALDSAAEVCDELIVVNAGSSDATHEVAARHGATVHDIDWDDDFSRARNASFDLCAGDWILWLDPEDVVPEASRGVLAALRAELTDAVDGMFCAYHGRFGDDGLPRLKLVRERLLRRASGLRWNGRAYESLAVAPERAALHDHLVIEHRSDSTRERRNLDRRAAIMSENVAEDRSPQALFSFANDLMYQERFSDAADTYREYLDLRTADGNRYWAHVSHAECQLILGDAEGGREALLQAIGEDSSRAEAFVRLARLHFDAEEWFEAVPLLVAATAAKRPGYGFARDADHSYAAWDYLSVCYEKLGRFDEALSAAQRGLPGNPQALRVRTNMHWMVDRL